MTTSIKFRFFHFFMFLVTVLMFSTMTACYEDDGELVEPVKTETDNPSPNGIRNADCDDPSVRHFPCR